MRKLIDVRHVVTIPILLVSACSYVDGQCWSANEDGHGGAGGGPVVPTGSGGFGDVPPQPRGASDPTPPDCNAGAEVRCATPASNACVDQCEAVGAYCVHLAKHPYSPSSGIGDLYWCKGGSPTWTCSYQYSNGDNCTVIYPLSTWLCSYTTGK